MAKASEPLPASDRQKEPRHSTTHVDAQREKRRSVCGTFGEQRQELLVLRLVAELADAGVDERVLNVDDDRDGRVHSRNLLDDQASCSSRHKYETRARVSAQHSNSMQRTRREGHASAAQLLRRLNAHEAFGEQALEQIRVHFRLLVHLHDLRAKQRNDETHPRTAL